MDRRIYRQMGEQEDSHWWFRGRRALVRRAIDRFCDLPAEPEVLDAGCGTGGNLRMLGELGRVAAFEMDNEAADVARSRGVTDVLPGYLPDAVPFDEGRFDLTVMTDVLEHVEDDAAALEALRRVVRPGGWLVMTVPALMMLWSRHDESHHHFRRYRVQEVRQRLTTAGFDVRWSSYQNSLLFPPIAAFRLAQRLNGNGLAHYDDVGAGPRVFNEMLYHLFASERFLVGRVPFPVGVSVLACAQRPAE